MTTRFVVPPQAADIRSMVEERLAEAVDSNGEKITIEWRGQPRHLFVISMPTELLYYNPDTHRIRAQRTLNPVLDGELETSPWEKAAQDYLDTLLKCQPSNPDKTDPDFEALRDDLELSGQKDPGIITTQGILVNGNTRCAALRELGERNIRVGVLPESSTWDDINTVELSLQLRKEHKRDYSYINRLIAIDELIKANRRPEDIARAFRIKLTTLEQDRWVYAVILDAIARSTTESGEALRLVDFEDHQEKLRELHRVYSKLAASDRDAAEVLKETRLAMIVLGYAKTDVRLAQADFHEKYLDAKLPEAVRTPAQSVTPVRVPGLPGVVLPGAAPLAKTTRLLTDKLLQAKAATQSGALKGTAAQIEEAAVVIDAAKIAFNKALVPAGKDIRLQQRKLAAPERLTDACDDIDLCTGELAQAMANRGLDEAAFDDAVIRLKTTLGRLAKQASRSITDPGEGISWLIEVAKVDS